MKHWDRLDPAAAEPLRLSPRDEAYLADVLERMRPARRRTPRANGASVVGLVLSLSLLAGLTWALWPDSPVAPEVLR
jgi:hypothetical protein